MPEALKEIEEKTLYEDDYSEVPPDDIVAYNELRSCADLYRMYEQGILEIQPEFQRDIVWQGPMQTRFVDSLIKQLPIPSMCFAQDNKRQKWIVIDGLQRMWTIIRFLKGSDWNLAKLNDIDPQLSGRSVAAIKDTDSELHKFYTRVENLSIPITVLRCDFSKKSHLLYLFAIFHRLNTGGMKLNNQEIRNCIYGGSFNSLLKELDTYSDWRKLNRMKVNESYRFTKQEMILRFFAFYDQFENYTGHLAHFLNTYMQQNQNAKADFITEKKELFKQTVSIALEKIYSKRPPAKISLSHMEAILVGIGRNLGFSGNSSVAELQQRYEVMISNPDFTESSLREGLSKKNKVIDRLRVAEKIFSGQP